jgi:chemotaxis signal transduction protein
LSSQIVSDSETQENCPVRRMQLVRVGSLELGLFEDEIAIIADWRKPIPLPRAPKAVLGVVSIQGRMLTVLNPLGLLGETATDNGFSPSHIIALRGAEQLALAVESVEQAIEVARAEIESPRETNAGPLLGILNHGEQSIRVLDVKKLFPAAIQGLERRRRRF